MMPRARIATAAVLVMAIASGVWLYLLWPRWYGTEVLLPVTLGARTGAGDVIASYPDSRLRLDATNTQAANAKIETVLVDVRSVGVVWDSHNNPVDEASRLRNRIVYLQLKPTDQKSTSGEPLWHAVTISTTRVLDVVNLRVEVSETNTAAQIMVNIAGGRLPITKEAAVSPAAAILKVLPSGRHAVVGVISGGQRHYF